MSGKSRAPQAAPAASVDEGAVCGPSEFGSNASAQEALVCEDPSQLVSSDPSMAGDPGAPTDPVAAAARDWITWIPELEGTLGGIRAAAQGVGQALRTGDAPGLEAGSGEIQAALAAFQHGAWKLAGQKMRLEATGADVEVLRAMYEDRLGATVRARLTPADANLFVPSELVGSNTTSRLTREQVPAPADVSDPIERARAYGAHFSRQVETWAPVLQKVAEVRSWARGLPHVDDLGVTAFARMMTEVASGPLAGTALREREYLEAVAIDVLHDQPEWVAYIRDGDQRMVRQIDASDAAGEELDFDALDDIVEEVEGEAESNFMDDDDVMSALRGASTPAERDYVARRLRDLGVWDDVGTRIDGEEADEFERWRQGAGDYSGSIGEPTDGYSIGEAALDSAQLVPGAVLGTAHGMVASIPALGDIYDEHCGTAMRGMVDDVHQTMGVDDADVRAMSTEISVAGGKAAGAVGMMAVGGAFTNGIRGFGALSAMGKVGVGAAGLGVGLDIGNNGYQAVTGEKVTGEKISGTEQALAGAGAVLGIADVGLAVGKTWQAGKQAKAVTELGDGASALGRTDEVMSSGDDVLRSADDVMSSADDVMSSGDDVLRSADDVLSSGDDVSDGVIDLAALQRGDAAGPVMDVPLPARAAPAADVGGSADDLSHVAADLGPVPEVPKAAGRPKDWDAIGQKAVFGGGAAVGAGKVADATAKLREGTGVDQMSDEQVLEEARKWLAEQPQHPAPGSHAAFIAEALRSKDLDYLRMWLSKRKNFAGRAGGFEQSLGLLSHLASAFAG